MSPGWELVPAAALQEAACIAGGRAAVEMPPSPLRASPQVGRDLPPPSAVGQLGVPVTKAM